MLDAASRPDRSARRRPEGFGVPTHPSAPELPLSRPLDDADPELVALPAPPRRERTVSLVLMAITAVVAALMAWALRGEVAYALASSEPADLGSFTGVSPGPDLANAFVRGTALLGTTGAIRYERPLESDSFRLAPVAANPHVWVEMRVPEGNEGPRFVPPTTFVGRLVPLASAGLRHRGIAASIRALTGVEVPKDAWLLVDGAAPASSRWAIPLAALFAFFAAWNVAQLVRLARPVKD